MKSLSKEVKAIFPTEASTVSEFPSATGLLNTDITNFDQADGTKKVSLGELKGTSFNFLFDM